MGFNCQQCEDSEHSCMAWDGTGGPKVNLVYACPVDKKKCLYRLTNTKTDPWTGMKKQEVK